MTTQRDPITELGALLSDAGLAYAVIGGHAVNAWLEPRFTADVGVTVVADPVRLADVEARFEAAGYQVAHEVGAELPSGPDFVRFVRGPGDPPIELQVAKTAYQAEVVQRARADASGIAIATAEDLIVLKLIAHRAKDLIDLHGLVALPDLDWPYIERWADVWDVRDRLEALRSA